MKNISLILASTLSIAFTIPVVDKTIAKPNKSKLPEVGIVKNTDVTHGCYYYQPDKITKKLEENRNNLIKQSAKLYKKEKSQQKERLLMQYKLDENVSFFEKPVQLLIRRSLDLLNRTRSLNGVIYHARKIMILTPVITFLLKQKNIVLLFVGVKNNPCFWSCT